LKYGNRIFGEQRVGCHDLQIVLQGLAYQHAVKRIAMVQREMKKMRQRRFVERQRCYVVLLTPMPQIFVCPVDRS
jgi:hypothetical protein